MSNPWTPGPWRYFPSGDFGGGFVINGSDEHGAYVLPILGRTHNWPRHAEANATLIASAPALVEALEALVEDVARYPAWERPCAALDAARAALSLAKGTQGETP